MGRTARAVAARKAIGSVTETGSGGPSWRLRDTEPSDEQPYGAGPYGAEPYGTDSFGRGNYRTDPHGIRAYERRSPVPRPAEPPERRRPDAYPPGEARRSAAAAPAPPGIPGVPPPRAEPDAPDVAVARQLGRGAALGFGRGGAHERELVRRVTVPVGTSKRVVVLSIKGGVGKTTSVAVMGSLLAAVRRDRVVALDASSDWGTLAARLSVVPRQTVRELAARGRHAVSEHGILAQLVASPSGLYVVGSDPQSMISAALGEEEYVQAVRLLEYVANLVLIDVGAGLQQPFLPAALRTCDQLVVATAATWDSAQSAAMALDWLTVRGFSGLVERSVVVMSSLSHVRRRRRGHVGELHADMARRTRAVHEVPFDPALQPGGRILLRKLSPATRLAFLEVAADVVAGAIAAPRTSRAQPQPAWERP